MGGILIKLGQFLSTRVDLFPVEVTRELLVDQFHTILEHRAAGETKLARTLSLVQYGDYLSCYLAEAAGVDPVPVSRIDVLKRRLQAGE